MDANWLEMAPVVTATIRPLYSPPMSILLFMLLLSTFSSLALVNLTAQGHSRSLLGITTHYTYLLLTRPDFSLPN